MSCKEAGQHRARSRNGRRGSGQVCADYQVPFAAMRTISDRADDDAHVDFTRFIETVASRYASTSCNAGCKPCPR